MNKKNIVGIKRNAPYNELTKKIIERYFRFWPIVLSIITGFLAGSFTFYSGITNNKPIIENLMLSFTILLLIIFSLWSVIIGLQNIFQSSYEEALLESGINFLKEQEYSDEKLKIIEKRSEIGLAAGQTRTLVPIIFFSITTPIIIIIKLPIEYFLYLFIIYVMVLLSFILEVDRSNIDAVVNQVCFIYRIERLSNITVNKDIHKRKNKLK